MTSDQRTSGSGGGYIEQRHLTGECGDGSYAAYAYQTTSGHGAQHAQLSITSTLLAPRLGLRTCRQ